MPIRSIERHMWTRPNYPQKGQRGLNSCAMEASCMSAQLLTVLTGNC